MKTWEKPVIDNLMLQDTESCHRDHSGEDPFFGSINAFLHGAENYAQSIIEKLNNSHGGQMYYQSDFESYLNGMS